MESDAMTSPKLSGSALAGRIPRAIQLLKTSTGHLLNRVTAEQHSLQRRLDLLERLPAMTVEEKREALFQ
jgi:hypothetical protein